MALSGCLKPAPGSRRNTGYCSPQWPQRRVINQIVYNAEVKQKHGMASVLLRASDKDTAAAIRPTTADDAVKVPIIGTCSDVYVDPTNPPANCSARHPLWGHHYRWDIHVPLRCTLQQTVLDGWQSSTTNRPCPISCASPPPSRTIHGRITSLSSRMLVRACVQVCEYTCRSSS